MADVVGVRLPVTVTAVALAALGGALLSAGADVSVRVFGAPVVEPLTSMFAAALFGFAGLNWTARGSALGGIYGRAVVVGNHWHFVVGAMVLLRHGLSREASATLWILTAGYVLGAMYFSYLLFASGVRRP